MMEPESPPPAPVAAAPESEADDLALQPIPYDPADYRWVPVRRRPRYDGWTEEKQRRFIEVLADTGLVSAAAAAVGMTREGAYRLRRSGHAAAFARAWDAARHHAGAVIEDVAFERAIEGIEHNVYDENGVVVCTKRVYNDRLLTFLLTHLKPERYARAALAEPAAPPVTVEASLRALEPPLPAPAPELLGAETLADELALADIADGRLPHFLTEQRPPKSADQLQAEANAARHDRGKAASAKLDRKEKLSEQEFRDMCFYIEPTFEQDRSPRRFR